DSKTAGRHARNIHDAWITERFGSDWRENPVELTVDDQDAKISYGTDLGRTMRTTDGGASWVAVYSRKSGENGWVSTGLDVTNAYGDPFAPFLHKRKSISRRTIDSFDLDHIANACMRS